MSRRLDVIALRGLAANGVHGVLPEEHRARQPFVVDLALWVDSSEAARTDDIADTVSYAVIADEVAAILTGPSVRLIETLGHRIADAVLAHELVRGVEVTVHKPKAPIAQTFSDVSVTVRRGECGPLPVLVEEGPADSSASTSIDEGAAPARFVGTVEAEAPAGAAPARSPAPVDREGAAEREPVRVLLALGGNIGDSPSILAAAVESLVDDARVEVLDVSPILRTAPVLAEGQDAQADYWNAVVLASTRLDPHGVLDLARALESAAGRVRVEHWGPRTLDVDVVDYDGIALDEPDLVLPHPRARGRAFVLAPWLMVDPSATLGGEPVSRLLEEAPDSAGIRDAVDDWLLDPGSVLEESDAVLAAGDELASAEAQPSAERVANSSKAAATSASVIGSVALGRAVEPDAVKDAASAVPDAPVAYGPSRLDLVPEASRLGLAPKDGEDDIVWKRLWARWSAPQPMAPARAPSELASRADGAEAPQDRVSAIAPDSGSDVSEDAAPAAPPAASSSSSEPVGGSALVDPGTARIATEAPEAPAEAESAEPESVDASGPRHGERRAEHRARREKRPRWFPVFGDRAEGADDGDRPGAPEPAREDAASGTEDAIPPAPRDPFAAPSVTVSHSPRRLPSWDFSRTDVRIVDEPGAAAQVSASRVSASGVSAEADAAPTAPIRRSIVDPHLPEGALRGPIPDSELTRTGLLRKVVVRPSSTGAIPIIKDRDCR